MNVSPSPPILRPASLIKSQTPVITHALAWVVMSIAVLFVLFSILRDLGYRTGDDAVAQRVWQWHEPLHLATLEQENRLPQGLLLAVMHQESAGNPIARSHAGAVGLFQFMRHTAKDMGLEDRTHPQHSARAAAQYLGLLYQRYDHNLELTLAAYNWGLGNVDAYLSPKSQLQGNTLTIVAASSYSRFGLSKMPAETQNYINRIKSLRLHYYMSS